MKKLLVLTVFLLTSTLSYASSSASHLKLSQLFYGNTNIVIVVNNDITPTGYSSRQFEVERGGILGFGKSTYRLNFSFERDGSWSKFLTLKKGTKLKVTQAKDGGRGFGFDSSAYLNASTPSRALGDGTFTSNSVYLQVLGSKSDTVEKLTLGDIENHFNGLIKFYFE